MIKWKPSPHYLPFVRWVPLTKGKRCVSSPSASTRNTVGPTVELKWDRCFTMPKAYLYCKIIYCTVIQVKLDNSLWPCGVIWRHRTWLTLVQVMACCLTTPSHYLCQWWLIIRKVLSWWRHQMETFSALLSICAGNSPVAGEFPAQRPVARSFDIIFDLRLNKRLSKQSWGWWFGTLSCPLWRQCNVWHSHEGNFPGNAQVIYPWYELKNTDLSL